MKTNKQVIQEVISLLPKRFKIEVTEFDTFEEAYNFSGNLRETLHLKVSGDKGKAQDKKSQELWNKYLKNVSTIYIDEVHEWTQE